MFWDKCCTWRYYSSNEQIAYVAQGSVGKWIDFNKVHNPLAGIHTHIGDSFVYNCAINLAFDSTQLPNRGQTTWSLLSSPMVGEGQDIIRDARGGRFWGESIPYVTYIHARNIKNHLSDDINIIYVLDGLEFFNVLDISQN